MILHNNDNGDTMEVSVCQTLLRLTFRRSRNTYNINGNHTAYYNIHVFISSHRRQNVVTDDMSVTGTLSDIAIHWEFFIKPCTWHRRAILPLSDSVAVVVSEPRLLVATIDKLQGLVADVDGL